VLEVEMVAFDDADFVELVERATADGPTRVRACLRDTGELIAGLVSASAAVVTAGLLHPVRPCCSRPCRRAGRRSARPG
jgi:ATP-binding cassette subfamily B protein